MAIPFETLGSPWHPLLYAHEDEDGLKQDGDRKGIFAFFFEF
jgi:hypothetical protein